MSIVMERPTETNNPTSSSNNPIDYDRLQWIPNGYRLQYPTVFRSVLAAETNNPTFSSNNQRSDSNDGSQYMAPASPGISELIPGLFPPVFGQPMNGFIDMGSAFQDDLNIIDNYHRFASNDGSPYMALNLQNLTDSFLRSLPVGFRRWLVGQTPVRQRLEMVTVLQNLLNVVANHAAITNNQGLIDLLLRRLPASFLLQTYDGSRYMAPALPSIDEPIRRLFPSGSSRPTIALDVESAISDDLNVPVDQPAEINNQRPFMSMSNVYQLLGSTMNTGSAVNLLILALFAFAEIKSQGDTEFPFQTHPHITRVAINSMPIYGLLFLAEHVISAAGPGPDSVYASIARAGRKLCLCILIGSLASLFYF